MTYYAHTYILTNVSTIYDEKFICSRMVVGLSGCLRMEREPQTIVSLGSQERKHRY